MIMNLILLLVAVMSFALCLWGANITFSIYKEYHRWQEEVMELTQENYKLKYASEQKKEDPYEGLL